MSSDSKENVNINGEHLEEQVNKIQFLRIHSDDVPLEDDPDLSSTSLLHELIDETPESSFLRLSLDEKKKSRETAFGLSFFSERSGKGLEISMEAGGSRMFEAQAIPVQSESIRMRRRKRAASLRPFYGSFRMPLMSKLGLSGAEEENLNKDSNPAGYVRQLLKYMDENPAAPSDKHPVFRRSSVLIHKSRLAKQKEDQETEEEEEEKEQEEEEEDEDEDDFQPDLYTPYTEEERSNLEKFMNEDKLSTFVPFGKLEYLSGEKGKERGPRESEGNLMPSTVVEKTRKPSFDDYYSGSYFNDQRILPSEGMGADRTGLWDREISDPLHLAGTTSIGIDKVLPTPRQGETISDSPEGHTPVPSTLTSLDDFINSGELEKLLPMDESKRSGEIDKALQLHTLDSLEDLIKKEGAVRGPREKMMSSVDSLAKGQSSKTKGPKSAISLNESSKSVFSRKKKLTFEESKPVTVFYPEMETPPPEENTESTATDSSPKDSE